MLDLFGQPGIANPFPEKPRYMHWKSDAAERSFNKLARTFTMQMAALKQYRTGGQQKMTIEHVHVYEGGQAIVGNVQGGGGVAKKGEPTP